MKEVKLKTPIPKLVINLNLSFRSPSIKLDIMKNKSIMDKYDKSMNS